MRKEIFLPLLLAIFVSLAIYSSCRAGVILAQNAGDVEDRLHETREKRQEIIDRQKIKRENLKERKQDVREKIATRQAEVKQRVVEKIKNVFSKILRRLNAALARLDKIAQRIAARIDKLNARGVDTSAAQSALLAAETKGSAAAVAIENAQAQIDAIDPSSASVRDAVHSARNAVASAKGALKEYHKALVEAIKKLKSAADLREGTESAD